MRSRCLHFAQNLVFVEAEAEQSAAGLAQIHPPKRDLRVEFRA